MWTLKAVQQQVEVEKKGDNYEVLNAPYLKEFSEGLERKLRRRQFTESVQS